MGLKVEKTSLPGVLLLEPETFTDARGYLVETFHAGRYLEAGVPFKVAQENQSYSTRKVLRGLHAQARKPQAKIVRAVTGSVYDVAVDARPSSPAFGRWFGAELSGKNHRQMFIPEGCLHGFCVLSEDAVVHYLCSAHFDPDDSFGVLWNDPELSIHWPIEDPVLSEKDKRNMSWKEAAGLLGRIG